ncbi:hypothetical protein QYE76_043293 [Lolium multiflorum]|uniref:Myb/SANT-like domain-containing protein n=1 Tax=Lolium multiflorum TaxID=4521 RepID=A0AAD8TGC4_LOLMU|nr:hypothetical protein QYE76_043293 [Lolium multiflorum]
MEMAGAAARIDEKRKGGGKDSVTSRRAMAYFYPLLHCPPKFRAPPPVGKQDSFCDDFSQTLVCVGDSQIPPQVPDSQPTYESKVTPLPVSDLVAQVAAEVAARLATSKKNKNRREVERALKTGQERNATMKWLPFMSSFVLEKMCGLIQSGVRTDKGFKEVHLNTVAKGLADHCGVTVCSTQVYNHLRKWRQRWLTISRLRDLSGAQWCEDTKCIVLEGEHYCGHVADHPKDAEFLNVPIANYNEMHTIFSFGLATGKYAMGSSEPLGSPAPPPAPEDADTHESDTVNLDKPDAPEKPTAGKGRGAFRLVVHQHDLVKEVAQAIRANKPMMTHKYRGCIIVLLINKSVEPNEEQKVLTRSFDEGFTVNAHRQVFRGF